MVPDDCGVTQVEYDMPILARGKSDLSLFIDELEAAVVTGENTPASQAQIAVVRRAERAEQSLAELQKVCPAQPLEKPNC